MSTVEDAEIVEPIPEAPERSNMLATIETQQQLMPYEGVATLAIPPEKAAKLAQILPDDEHDILPTGELYVSQVRYRRILNDTFGPGSWALVPRSAFWQEGNTICREYALFADGKFVSEAIGEQDYKPSNARMSYATAAESVKSNALMRCCKDLGIASECWDKHWTEEWKRKYAVCVQVMEENWRNKQDEKKWRWRRRDGRRLPREIGEAPSGEQGNTTAAPARESKPAVQMPRAKAAEPEQQNLDEALQQSLTVISRQQQVKLFAAITASKHTEEEFREWLQRVAGLSTTKLIPATKLDAILRRLEDETPLAVDYSKARRVRR